MPNHFYTLNHVNDTDGVDTSGFNVIIDVEQNCTWPVEVFLDGTPIEEVFQGMKSTKLDCRKGDHSIRVKPFKQGNPPKDGLTSGNIRMTA